MVEARGKILVNFNTFLSNMLAAVGPTYGHHVTHVCKPVKPNKAESKSKFRPTNLEVIYKRDLLFQLTIIPGWLTTQTALHFLAYSSRCYLLHQKLQGRKSNTQSHLSWNSECLNWSLLRGNLFKSFYFMSGVIRA